MATTLELKIFKNLSLLLNQKTILLPPLLNLLVPPRVVLLEIQMLLGQGAGLLLTLAQVLGEVPRAMVMRMDGMIMMIVMMPEHHGDIILQVLKMILSQMRHLIKMGMVLLKVCEGTFLE